MIYQSDKLRKLQLEEKKILLEVKKYCDKKAIRYYLAFGTLLGAVRHKGFIPWDDDVDIFMKRPDYERFLKEANNDLPDWLTIRTYKNTKLGEGNFTIQAKVEANNIYVMRQVGQKLIKQRIWIDIFIIDGMPKTKFGRTVHYYNIALHSAACRIARSKTGHNKEVKRPLIETFGIKIAEGIHLQNYFPIIKTYDSMDKLLKKYDVDYSDYVICYAKAYGKNTIVEEKYIGSGKKLLFEGEEFNAPANPDTLLRNWYGDYMQLPPEEKQVAKHCTDIIIE